MKTLSVCNSLDINDVGTYSLPLTPTSTGLGYDAVAQAIDKREHFQVQFFFGFHIE
jgi:hypothetical protein